MINSSIDDKTVVKEYFNATGFDRWRRIYGEGEVNKVQKDIRIGHQQTIDTILSWLKPKQGLLDITICDAGCGVGSLSIPLASAGAKVYASDISQKMVEEAQTKAKEFLGQGSNPVFTVQDLEALEGKYNTVVCVDVLIHYPKEQVEQMITHLASLSSHRLIVSFAPKTFLLSILKKIGQFFPGASKTTRAYQHQEEEIIRILLDLGFHIERKDMTSTSFYYSRILEALRD